MRIFLTVDDHSPGPNRAEGFDKLFNTNTGLRFNIPAYHKSGEIDGKMSFDRIKFPMEDRSGFKADLAILKLTST